MTLRVHAPTWSFGLRAVPIYVLWGQSVYTYIYIYIYTNILFGYMDTSGE